MSQNLIYIGANNQVAAIDTLTGRTVWQKTLKTKIFSGNSFVTILVDGKFVFAHTAGHLFCLEATTGAILWSNSLTGLGYGLGCIATSSSQANGIEGAVSENKLKKLLLGAAIGS